MTSHVTSRRLQLAAFAVASIVAGRPAPSAARTEAGLRVEQRGVVASNPFLDVAGNLPSVSVLLEVAPFLTIIEDTTRLEFDAELRVVEFARIYPRSQSLRARASGLWRLTPRVDVETELKFETALVGETALARSLLNGAITLPIVTAPAIVISDPTIIGLRTRRQTSDAKVSAQYRPDARQRFWSNLYARDTRFSTATTGDYAVYGGTVGYSRLFRRQTLGASFGVQRYDCRSLQACSQVVLSPQLTASIILDAAWSLSGSAGVSFSSLELTTLSRKTVAPALNATLCRKDARASMCFTGAHSVEATARDGARPILSFDLSSHIRLTDRNTLVFSGSYAATTGTVTDGDSSQYIVARVTNEHRVSRQMSLTVSGSHAISRSTFLGDRRNTEVAVGVHLSIGRRA